MILSAVLLIGWLAPFLGGCTEAWSQGVLCVAIGLCVWWWPPRRRLRFGWFYVTALIFIALPFLSFLPARWYGSTPWRETISRDLLISLPWTATPQPWISLECWLLLLAGTLWLVYMTTLPLSSQSRWNLARWYAAGITVLAAVALVSYGIGKPLPFWHAREAFGFFPNRNQMADWLAMGGLLIPALIYQDWGWQRVRAGVWIVAILLIGTALVVTFSRAGILFFFAGMGLFLVWIALVRRWTARLVLCLVGMVGLATLFLIFGGATLARFQDPATGVRDAGRPAARLQIQSDALTMNEQSPVCGVGLGNFSAIFALYRDESRNEARAIHPESDWLWLAGEAGWGGIALIWVGVIFIVRAAFPVERGTARTLRIAAVVAGMAFLAHSFVDVSGHRLGTFIPACLFVALWIHPKHFWPVTPRETWLFRGVAALVILSGLYLIATSVSPSPLPGRTGVERSKALADEALRQGKVQEALHTINRALRWAPLDWELYYRRAVARLTTSPESARQDFQRARNLEPNYSELPLREGYCWLNIEPTYAVSAWREALNRNHHNPLERFGEMINASKDVPMAHEGLKWLSLERPDLFLSYAASANPQEFAQMRSKIIMRFPKLDNFNYSQKQKFFSIWSDKEGLQPVVEAALQIPSWKEAAWPFIARDMAQRSDYQGAYSMAKSMLQEPTFPRINNTAPLKTLQSRVQLAPSDFAAAYILVKNYTVSGNFHEALSQARISTRQDGCPNYFHYLRANAAASSGEWKEAWEAMQTYMTLTRQGKG